MMARFNSVMRDFLDYAQPESLLDVGCGEGVQSDRCARHRPKMSVVGVDLDDVKLRREWEERTAPNLSFHHARIDMLPFADSTFHMVSALEVLEHVPDPEAALQEMARVAEQWLMLSVPREPIWRLLNMARGAYIKDFGNTPGHINHWSQRRFLRLVEQFGRLELVQAPFPWTMILVRLS